MLKLISMVQTILSFFVLFCCVSARIWTIVKISRGLAVLVSQMASLIFLYWV